MNQWTEGICGDGVAILRDGEMVPIDYLLSYLNEVAALYEAMDQLLDDMGEQGLCVCQAAKDQAKATLARVDAIRGATKQ